MKLSVSLSAEDVATLDEHARTAGLPSRSAALHQAVRLLRQSALEEEYSAAWADWERSEDRELWETAAGDGVS